MTVLQKQNWQMLYLIYVSIDIKSTYKLQQFLLFFLQFSEYNII